MILCTGELIGRASKSNLRLNSLTDFFVASVFDRYLINIMNIIAYLRVDIPLLPSKLLSSRMQILENRFRGLIYIQVDRLCMA